MGDCIFCKIANGATGGDLVHEHDQVVAFRDINPQAPVHIQIIPRGHFASIKEMDDERLMGHLFAVGNSVAKKLGIESFRYVINTGKEAGQAVFHVHLHLLGGRTMTWPPG